MKKKKDAEIQTKIRKRKIEEKYGKKKQGYFREK